ncbi:tudor domain-containing protein 5 isoform X2 [Phyllostomus hastatus]|uniref:tudor domain-containing protein 5 isoform X2 n=1 Tax=Phyllostomus hastatus TaxID=9423 RepID=UPI001E684D42|nr:tudor domain-containing protein 5 isoform X2 [Phyllostomus hastatus]
MSDQERIQECLRKEIRSLLISAKDGLTPQQLEKEYLLMVGSHLPLRILGYRSTMELVLDMPDVVSICPGGDGTVILKAIPDESTKGIASLVAKQRSSHKVRSSMQKGRTGVCLGPSFHRQVPYRGRVPPILPAVVKSELKDLLALSPVLLSDFDKAFAKRFGRSFQYMQYGFLSMFEVLNAASDVISVEQTRAGSLLMLKKSTSEEKPRGWPVEGKIFTQPFRMKQEGSTPPGFPGAKARFSRPSVNMEPAKQVLNVRKTPEASGAEMSRLNDTEKLNQLENTFKSVIAQIGPGGTINPELKHKIKFVVSKFPEGLLISKLLREFEVVFKEQLSPKKLGFLNVIELVGALSDILYVEFREAEQDLLLFDADLRPLPRDGAVSSVRNTCLVQSDKKIEAKACVSSPPRNASSSAAAQRENTWAWSFKHHKEPEQKSYKKPNLVVKPLQLQLEMDKSQLNMAAASHDIPPDSVRDRKLCRLPPLDTSTLVGVFVEYVISPSQFYIRIYSRDSSELLEDMMIEMRRCYSNQLVSDRYVMPEHFIRPGHLCCVRISEDKWWYRVVIHRVLGKQEVEVFYPDFGNIGTVQKSSLRFLKCCYTKLPAQAIPCSLAWVRPTEGYWTSTAVLQFQKLCGLKPLVGVVDEYIDGILNIFLCDTSSNEDVYFHHVLRAEGHAIVCRENVPSKGFSELNPLALYTKSSGGPEDAVLTERVCPSQHHYFKEVQEISPQSKESDLYTLDEIPTGMPCLESVTIGDDVWDENWLPVHAKMGPGGDAAPHLLTSSRGGEKPYRSREETPEKDWCFSTQDVWDDSCQPLGLENGTQVKVQEPEGRGAQEKSAGAPRVPKQSHLEGSSDPSALPELEEFYVSLVQSQQPAAAGSQGEPPGAQRQPGPVPRSAAALDAAPPAVGPPERRSGSVESSPESLKNEDLSSSHALTVFTDKSRGAMDQLSLILSPEHQIPQRFYIPRSTATAALGAAARLATSRSFLHWYPSVKGMEA